jgi:hypothetical protein
VRAGKYCRRAFNYLECEWGGEGREEENCSKARKSRKKERLDRTAVKYYVEYREATAARNEYLAVGMCWWGGGADDGELRKTRWKRHSAALFAGASLPSAAYQPLNEADCSYRHVST